MGTRFSTVIWQADHSVASAQILKRRMTRAGSGVLPDDPPSAYPSYFRKDR